MVVAASPITESSIRLGRPAAAVLAACVMAMPPSAAASNELVEVSITRDGPRLVMIFKTSGVPPEPVLIRREGAVEGHLPGVSPAAEGCFLDFSGTAVKGFQFRRDGDGLSFSLELHRAPSGLQVKRETGQLLLQLAEATDDGGWANLPTRPQPGAGDGPQPVSAVESSSSPSPHLTAGWPLGSWEPRGGIPAAVAIILLVQSALASALAVLALRRRVGAGVLTDGAAPELEDLRRKMARDLQQLQKLRGP